MSRRFRMNRTGQDGEMHRVRSMMWLVIGCACVCGARPRWVRTARRTREQQRPWRRRPSTGRWVCPTDCSVQGHSRTPARRRRCRVSIHARMKSFGSCLPWGWWYFSCWAFGSSCDEPVVRLGGGGRPSGVLQVHGRYPMGRGQALVLLQIGDRMVLVHQGGGRMQTLTEFTNEQDVAELKPDRGRAPWLHAAVLRGARRGA